MDDYRWPLSTTGPSQDRYNICIVTLLWHYETLFQNDVLLPFSSMIYKSSRHNVTARSRNAQIHQIRATLNICRGSQLRAPAERSEEISPREFPRPIKTRKRPGGLSRSTPLPPPSAAAPRIALRDARWGIRWRHDHVDKRARKRQPLLPLLLTHALTLRFYSGKRR